MHPIIEHLEPHDEMVCTAEACIVQKSQSDPGARSKVHLGLMREKRVRPLPDCLNPIARRD
jgi:hypothetical protein